MRIITAMLFALTMSLNVANAQPPFEETQRAADSLLFAGADLGF